MSKVTVVGAGNVGATCANVLAFNEVADEVVMLDVKEGVSEGKAMDMMQTAQLLGFDSTLVGCTNDYAQTANSDVVVITFRLFRSENMDSLLTRVIPVMIARSNHGFVLNAAFNRLRINTVSSFQ